MHLSSLIYSCICGLNNQLLHCGSGSICTWFIFSELSNVRAALHHFQRSIKCQRCSWPCALHPSFRFHQTLCPEAQVLLHGPREQALTFEDRNFLYIYLFSRRRENRASASIDFSYVCSESVAKFWEFHIYWLLLKTTPKIFFLPWDVIKCFTSKKSQYVLQVHLSYQIPLLSFSGHIKTAMLHFSFSVFVLHLPLH